MEQNRNKFIRTSKALRLWRGLGAFFLVIFCFTAHAQVELVSGGTGAAYTVAFPGVLTYANGISVTFKAHTANADAATLNISGLGAKPLKKQKDIDLAVNDILSGQFVTVFYDGTNFQVTSALGSAGGGGGGGTLAGDVTGATGSNTVARIRGVNVSGITPQINQVLQFSGVSWEPTTLSGGGGSAQTLSLNGDTLFISDGNFVVLGTSPEPDISGNANGDACTGTYTTTYCTGIIDETNGAGYYGSSVGAGDKICRWLIQPGSGLPISLVFGSSSGAAGWAGDTVYIYDGTSDADELLGKVTGVFSNMSFTAQSGAMFIRFVVADDFNHSHFGWTANYTCGSLPSAQWKTSGNWATANSFIGSLDQQPLRFRTGGEEKMNLRLDGGLELINSGFNTYVGNSAGAGAEGGDGNIGIGNSALHLNRWASGHIAIGNSALYSFSGGGSHAPSIAIGNYALSGYDTDNDYGFGYNIAIGDYAMGSVGMNVSSHNIAIGYNALGGGLGVFDNTVIGYSAGGNGGSSNTVLGNYALINNSCGTANVAVGHGSLGNSDCGNYNTALGFSADIATGNLSNATAIGAHAIVDDDNKIRLGDANVTVIEGQVAYSFPSDARFKTNVSNADVKGLDFITKLRPVNYNFDTKRYEEFLTKNMPDSIRRKHLARDFSKSTDLRQTGFIAQEVEKAAKAAGYDFSGGLHIPQNENDNYSVAYSQFVVPLVKAVQELNERLEKLEKENAELRKKIERKTER